MSIPIHATVVTKSELQSAVNLIKSQLVEKGFTPKLSKLQDSISLIISGRKWSSLLSEWDGEQRFFRAEVDSKFIDYNPDTIDGQIIHLLSLELPLWTVVLMGKEETVFHHYDGQYQPQPAYLEIDFEKKGITADYSGEIGNAVPSTVFHGIRHRANINPLLTSESINELLLDEAILRKITEIDRLGEVDWNGSSWAWGFKEGVDIEEYRDIWIDLDELVLDASEDKKSIYNLDFEDMEEQQDLLAQLRLDGTNTEDIKELIIERYKGGTGDEINGSNIDLDHYLSFDSVGWLPLGTDDFYYKIIEGVVYRSVDDEDGFEGIESFGENDFSGLNESIGDLVKAPFWPNNAI